MQRKLHRVRDVIRIVLLNILAVGGYAIGYAQPPAAAPPKYIPPACLGKPLITVPRSEMEAAAAPAGKLNPPIKSNDQVNVFIALTKAIDANYVYRDFNGQDWPALVAGYRAKVEQGLDTEAFYAEMMKLVKQLGDDHSYFAPPADVSAIKATLAGKNTYVGVGALFKLMVGKNRVSILSVIPDSPADKIGLKPHDTVLAVDGFPLVENDLVQQWRTRGPECSLAVLTVESPGQQKRDISVVRFRISAPLPVFTHLVTTSDGRRIGYIFVPSFFDLTVTEQVKKALASFGRLDGLIIDNRMNGGGSSLALEPMLGLFTSGTVGHYLSPTGRRALTITAGPVANSQTVPLAVLVGKDTVSYGEVFAGVLQDLGRARIVGQTTKGNVETLRGFNFEDGSQAWIAVESFEPLRSRIGWEKRGVRPDVEAHADWDTFTIENDPGIAAAVKLLIGK